MPFEVNILFVVNTIDQLSCQFFGFNFKYGIIKCAVVNTFMCIFIDLWIKTDPTDDKLVLTMAWYGQVSTH